MKKVIFLFVALLLPACIFLFLKMFGKNEFDVSPLFKDEYPKGVEECGVTITLPYVIPDTVQAKFKTQEKPLTLLYLGPSDDDSEKQLNRIKRDFQNEITVQKLQDTPEVLRLKRCTFFLTEPHDLVLLDLDGVIRGQYISKERKEMDRLVTELAVLLKQY